MSNVRYEKLAQYVEKLTKLLSTSVEEPNAEDQQRQCAAATISDLICFCKIVELQFSNATNVAKELSSQPALSVFLENVLGVFYNVIVEHNNLFQLAGSETSIGVVAWLCKQLLQFCCHENFEFLHATVVQLLTTAIRSLSLSNSDHTSDVERKFFVAFFDDFSALNSIIRQRSVDYLKPCISVKPESPAPFCLLKSLGSNVPGAKVVLRAIDDENEEVYQLVECYLSINIVSCANLQCILCDLFSELFVHDKISLQSVPEQKQVWLALLAMLQHCTEHGASAAISLLGKLIRNVNFVLPDGVLQLLIGRLIELITFLMSTVKLKLLDQTATSVTALLAVFCDSSRCIEQELFGRVRLFELLQWLSKLCNILESSSKPESGPGSGAHVALLLHHAVTKLVLKFVHLIGLFGRHAKSERADAVSLLLRCLKLAIWESDGGGLFQKRQAVVIFKTVLSELKLLGFIDRLVDVACSATQSTKKLEFWVLPIIRQLKSFRKIPSVSMSKTLDLLQEFLQCLVNISERAKELKCLPQLETIAKLLCYMKRCTVNPMLGIESSMQKCIDLLLKILINSNSGVLITLCRRRESITGEDYRFWASIVERLLFANLDSKLSATTNVRHYFSVILSLPWLQSVDQKDLKSSDLDSLFRQGLQLPTLNSTSLDLDVLSVFLKGLAQLPGDVCPQWRTNIFKMCLSDSTIDVASVAVSCVPMLLSTLSPAESEKVFSELILETINPKTTVHSKVFEKCCEILGPCACILSRSGIIQWHFEHHVKNADCVRSKWHVYCSFCSQLKENSCVNENERRIHCLNPALVFPFQRFLTQETYALCSLELRTALCKSMFNVATHLYGARSVEPFLLSVLIFMSDIEPSVQLMFGNILAVIARFHLRKALNKQIGAALSEYAFDEQFTSENSCSEKEIVAIKFYAEIAKHANFKWDGAAELHRRCVVSLCCFVVDWDCELALGSLAADALRDVAKVRQLKMAELLCEVSRELWDAIVARFLTVMTRVEHMNIRRFIYTCIAKLACVFAFVDGESPDMETFLSENIKHLEPAILVRPSPEATALHIAVANLLKTNRHSLIARNFRYILLKVTLRPPNSEPTAETIFKFVVGEGDGQTSSSIEGSSNGGIVSSANGFHSERKKFELEDYMSWDMYNCLNELLLNLSRAPAQILKVIVNFARMDLNANNTKNVTVSDSDENIVGAYINQRLLGILMKFEMAFKDPYCSLAEKHTVLQSLTSLMNMIKVQSLSQVRFKIHATLKVASTLENADFRCLCCCAWSVFVENLKSEPAALASILSQTVVAVMPLMSVCEEETSKILELLFNDSRSQIRVQIRQLSFVLMLPEFSQLNKYTSKFAADSERLSLAECLQHCLSVLVHENQDVKLLALKRILYLLRMRQPELLRLIINAEVIEQVIVDLVNTLMETLRCGSNEVKHLCAKCFGALGAVDPAKLSGTVINSAVGATKDNTVYAVFDFETGPIASKDVLLSVVQFPKEVLLQLSRIFLGAPDGGVFDAASFAIQEVLKFYKSTDQRTSTTASAKTVGTQLWELLPTNIQDTIRPLLSSNYVPKSSSLSFANAPHPVYGSKPNMDFNEWLKTWLLSLINQVGHVGAREFFRNCSIVAQADQSFGVYFLPHVILRILMERQTVATKQILEEMLAVLNYPSVVSNNSTPSSISFQNSGLKRLAVQIVFSIVDTISGWLHGKYRINAPGPGVVADRILNEKERQFKHVKQFLEQLPEKTLADASFNCQVYTRALRHLEGHIKERSTNENKSLKPPAFSEEILQENIEYLQKLYSCLDDADNVEGAITVRERYKPPSYSEFILAYESAGNYTEALPLHQQATKANPDNVEYRASLAKCLMKLNQPGVVQKYLDGLLKTNPEWQPRLNQYVVEAAWKLQDWTGLDAYLPKKQTASSWGFSVGNIISSAYKGDMQSVKLKMDTVQHQLINSVAAVALESNAYERSYKYIMRMHLLGEMEQALQTMALSKNNNANGVGPISVLTCGESMMKPSWNISSPKDLLTQWNMRSEIVESSSRRLETLFEMRRALLGLGTSKAPDLQRGIGYLWLESARAAMKAGHLQSAWSFIVNAREFNLPEVFVEEANFHWAKRDSEAAIKTLKDGLRKHYGLGNPVLKTSDLNSVPFSAAKAQLLLAKYSEESAATDHNFIIEMYSNARSMRSDWEDPYYFLGRYHDKLWQWQASNTAENRGSKILQTVISTVKYYGDSMKYGSNWTQHSMTRMLTLWLDFRMLLDEPAQKLSQRGKDKHAKSSDSSQGSSQHDYDSTQEKLNAYISKLPNEVPLYLFYTACQQLISRILHPCSSVVTILQDIIARLIVAYPEQCLWLCISVLRSRRPDRAKACRAIIEKSLALNPSIKAYVDAVEFGAEQLSRLCLLRRSNTSAPPQPLSIKKDFAVSGKTLGVDVASMIDKNRKPVLLPLQIFMEAVLPRTLEGEVADRQHNPFARKPVYIAGIDDQVEVMNSLQRPRKIGIRGSDGQKYFVMCKAHDDLRVDSRLLEFNRVVNGLLRRDGEARRRHLNIRTYSVIPLSEEAGLVEWVVNLEAIRFILLKLYREFGHTGLNLKIKNHAAQKSDSLETKLKIFETHFLPSCPPLLSEWFRRNFLDPSVWYFARCNYVRTCAVMSMVGFVLGLGDRHGENILLDSGTGDAFHVDFNCLFNKGETLDWPELVPFRLTHNMVDAMGPIGYEGSFRRVCEVTMRLMRQHREMLCCILQTFLHDPLLEWTKQPSQVTQNNAAAAFHKDGSFPHMGLKHLQDIETRLKGSIRQDIKGRYGGELSVEGQVNHLIQQATDKTLLAQMYIGWAAYM